MKKYALLIYALLLMYIGCFAQGYSVKNEKAIKYYKEGQAYFNAMQYAQAIETFKKAIKEEKNFVEVYFSIGEVYYTIHKIDSLIAYYKLALKINPTFYKEGFFLLANAQMGTGDYENAKINYELYLKNDNLSPIATKIATKYLKDSEFGIYAMQHPVPFNPINLGPNINTEFDEYWPSLSADEKVLIYTVMLPIDKSRPISAYNRQEDFFYSIKNGEQWTTGKPFTPPLNTPNNEGGQTISADGRYMVFTGCNRREDGFGLCDLYFTEKKGNEWTVPMNIGPPVSTNYQEKHPSLSADGRVLFFASNRQGSKGGLDIWQTTKLENGKWSEPINLGDTINTSSDDISPFIHNDNQTLYFSSAGLTGMGSQDIFMSRKDLNGKWSKPQNLGYPLNTNKDEIGLFINAKGNIAYFSSDRDRKDKDIYQVELYANARPIEVSYMKGKVFDAGTKANLEATFELIDLKTGQIVVHSLSDKITGEFLITIPARENYALNISKKGYLFYSENFALEKVFSQLEPYVKNIPLQKIQAGEKIILKNIFFETDSYILKDESKVELDKVLQLMRDNPTVIIEISGHTDNVGSDEYNQKLSENRSKSVVEYLIKAGVPVNRMKYKGYGEKQPAATNDTEEGRSQNRRTELKVISN